MHVRHHSLGRDIHASVVEGKILSSESHPRKLCSERSQLNQGVLSLPSLQTKEGSGSALQSRTDLILR